MSDDTPHLGDYLKFYRRETHLTLREVEERTGVSNSYISQLETNAQSGPHPAILRKLATAYHCSYERLMYLAGYWEPVEPSDRRRAITEMIISLDDDQVDEVRKFVDYLRFRQRHKRMLYQL